MYQQILTLITFITLSMLVGGLAFANMAVVPTFTALSTDHYAEFHHFLDRYSDPYMPILTFGTALLALGGLWFTQPTWQIVSRVIGIICILSVAVTSILIHGPLNKRIRTWQPGKQLEGLAEIRAKWAAGHRFRTVIAFVGLVALLLPVIFAS